MSRINLKSAWRKPTRKSIIVLYGLGAVLLVAAGVFWCLHRSNNPEHVFWSMISQSMSTTGVTVDAEQTGQDMTSTQVVQYSFGGNNAAHMLTTLKQSGTTVIDELIGTTTADYVRYVDIKTDQKTADGKEPNFSKILGVWASNEQSAQLFPQAVMGTGLPLGGVAVPIANLSHEARTNLTDQIRSLRVYQTNFSAAKKQQYNGRSAFVYDVTIEPVAYATMMKSFAQKAGLHDLDQLDPSSFVGQPAFKLRLTVDIASRHLVEAAPVDSASAHQTYHSYDVPVTATKPANPITSTELQKRLSEVQ